MQCGGWGLSRRANIKAELKKCGDLGDIAITCKSKQKLLFPPPPLTVRSLYKDFRSIAEMEVSPSILLNHRGASRRTARWA